MRYCLLVFSNPTDGLEQEYNAWYNRQHFPDLLKIPGITAARRYRFNGLQFDPSATSPARYLAIYEIETDDIAGVFAEINARNGTPAMIISGAIDMASVSTAVFEQVA